MAHISPYETPNGKKYRVRWRDENNRQREKRGFARKRDAIDFKSELEGDFRSGTYVAPTAGKATIATLGADWMIRQTHLAPSTLRSVETAWRVHVMPRWGPRSTSSIKQLDISRWISELSNDGKSATVVLRAFGVLRGILDDAVSAKLIKTSPALGVKNLPRKKKGEHTYLNHLSVQRLADSAGGQWRLLVYLACYTGMRWGEITGLRVGDLDFEKRRVRIVRNAVESGSKFHVGTPKSGKKRTAPLPGFLADELKDFCAEKSHASLVFEAPRRGGFILRPKPKGRSEGGTGGSWWALAKEEAEVPPQMRIHDMRHTAASLAVQSGAHVKVLQHMLGHASAAMTLDTYSDLFDDDLDQVSEALDAHRSEQLRMKCGQNVGK